MIQPQLGLVLVYAGHFDYRLEPYPPGGCVRRASFRRMPGRTAGSTEASRRGLIEPRRRFTGWLAERELVEAVRHLGQPGQDRRRDGRRRAQARPTA